MDAANWLHSTRELLRVAKEKYTLESIAKESNVSIGWLNDFSTERHENPGILHVQQLYNFLKTLPL